MGVTIRGARTTLAIAFAASACNVINGLNEFDTCPECMDGGVPSPGEGGPRGSADSAPPRGSESGTVDAVPVPDTAGDAADAASPLPDVDSSVPADGSFPDADGSVEADIEGSSGDDGSADSSAGDAAADSSGAQDGGSITVGLVALYRFDEASGTSAADSSGNNHTAALMGGAAFAPGLQNNGVTLTGMSQYVSLPSGIVTGLQSFSVSVWVKLAATPTWSRIFDFGTGTTTYMFLTPNSGNTARFSATTGGATREQQINATSLSTGSWIHVVVTLAANVGTLYVNGASAASNANMTVNPSSLGATTQNWLGRSEFAMDPYLNGQLDNLRIYSRALSAAEVQTLYSGHL